MWVRQHRSYLHRSRQWRCSNFSGPNHQSIRKINWFCERLVRIAVIKMYRQQVHHLSPNMPQRKGTKEVLQRLMDHPPLVVWCLSKEFNRPKTYREVHHQTRIWIQSHVFISLAFMAHLGKWSFSFMVMQRTWALATQCLTIWGLPYKLMY